jgi:hypothetical protein
MPTVIAPVLQLCRVQSCSEAWNLVRFSTLASSTTALIKTSLSPSPSPSRRKIESAAAHEAVEMARHFAKSGALNTDSAAGRVFSSMFVQKRMYSVCLASLWCRLKAPGRKRMRPQLAVPRVIRRTRCFKFLEDRPHSSEKRLAATECSEALKEPKRWVP